MRFEWDVRKASPNAFKHGVTFNEATTVFADGLSVTGRDLDHSDGEARYLTFGVSTAGRILAVSHTDRHGFIRIISAREATRREKRIYEEG